MVNIYVDGNLGLPVFRGPYIQSDAQIAALLFSADYDQLTKLCYQYLIAPSNGKTIYVPVLPSVLVVYADMFVSSLDERDKQVGRIRETEVSFWVLTAAMQKVGPVLVPKRLAWFVPSLLVDESNAIATGREVFGFNKLMAQIHKPQTVQSPNFAVDVLGFKTFDPDSVAQMERLLEVSPFDKTSLNETSPTWESWDQAKSEIDQELLKNIESAPKNKIIEYAAKLVNNRIPLVFLKQFRDVTNTQQACYQAIVEAPIRVKRFHQGGFLSDKSILNLNPLDSHPLARTLGLKLEDGRQRSAAGLWMKVDFTLEEGREVWRAG